MGACVVKGKRVRALLCGAGIVGASLLAAPDAFATTASISPATQSHAYGVLSSWTLIWSGQSAYKVNFTYGDGGSWSVVNTTATSEGRTHHFYPCSTTTFSQSLKIYQPGNSTPTASSSSTSHETGGGAC